MRKVKNVLIVLLTLVLLTAGSLLPMAAAQWQDRNTANVVQYADIEALQLKLEQEESRTWLSFFEKIQLITTGIGIEITADMMNIKEDRVVETVVAGLYDYMVDCLILVGDMYYDELILKPVMVYDENDPSKCNYYWWVTMSLDAYEDDLITVILDDETGEILALECWNLPTLIEDSFLEKYEGMVSANYFGKLGISPTGAKQINMEVAATEPESDTGIRQYAVHYQCINILYGEINIEIHVNANGFCVSVI